MKEFKLKTNYANYNVYIETNHYRSTGALALSLLDADTLKQYHESDLICMISVNIPDEADLLGKDEFFVDENNCPWAPKFLSENNIADFTGKIGHSGYCTYPVYKLTNELLRNK